MSHLVTLLVGGGGQGARIGFIQEVSRYSKMPNTSRLQKGPDKQRRPKSDCFLRSSLIRVFSVWYSDKRLLNFSPDKQHFLRKTEREGVQIFVGSCTFVLPFLSEK